MVSSCAPLHCAHKSRLTHPCSTARTLKIVGEAQLEVAQLHQGLLDTVGISVLQELEQTVRDFKDFERKYKEAEKLRTSLEAKLAKVGPLATELSLNRQDAYLSV